MEYVPMTLVGVRVEVPTNKPIVLLKEAHGDRYLPIWIGEAEATAIAYGQRGEKATRPLTHDLMRDVLTTMGVELLSVTITGLKDGAFESYLSLSNDSTVSSRPSDAIALAIRAGAPILASADVLDEFGIAIPDDDAPDPG